MGERERQRLGELGSCPYCHETVRMADDKTACEQCAAWHHRECWSEHGACSACGHQRGPSGLAPAPAESTPPAPVPQPLPVAPEAAPRLTQPWRVDGGATRPSVRPPRVAPAPPAEDGPCSRPGCSAPRAARTIAGVEAALCQEHLLDAARGASGTHALLGTVCGVLSIILLVGDFGKATPLAPLLLMAAAAFALQTGRLELAADRAQRDR